MKEEISALMDDELDADGRQHLLKGLVAGDELTAAWSTYHLIGDAMRGERLLGADFHAKLMQQLDAEPTVLAPVHKKPHTPAFWMTAAASVAAVMFVGWMVMQQQAQPTADLTNATLAQGAVSPESMNSYLVAHHSTFDASGMQTAHYVQPIAMNGNGN